MQKGQGVLPPQASRGIAHRMPHPALADITTWVFDLDNTLYPPRMRLFDQIEDRMTTYVSKALNVSAEDADRLRSAYWKTYGTTLAGLMKEHDLDPWPYLDAVHDISFHPLTPDPDLAAHIKALPGRRIVYTNGCAPYAEKVIEARGLTGLFDAIYGVEHAEFAPKPDVKAFETVFGLDGFDRSRAVMFEDDARNLKVPKQMGLATVHVAEEPEQADFVDVHTDDLTRFFDRHFSAVTG